MSCFGKQWLWCCFVSNKIVLELCPILNEPGGGNWHRRNGLWKAYFPLCQLGRQILIHPKSAYPIYISKGGNPFNFHEIGCLLEGDLSTWNTGIGPIGFLLRGHHTWEITLQITDVFTSSCVFFSSLINITFQIFKPTDYRQVKYLNTLILDAVDFFKTTARGFLVYKWNQIFIFFF